jgi:hypothetical protein
MNNFRNLFHLSLLQNATCVFLVLLLLLSGCKKRDTEPREAFTIRGHVSDKITRQPVAGATVRILAEEKSRFRFFGTPEEGAAGSATTDAAGNFAVIPYEFSFTHTFDITAVKNGVVSEAVTIYKEDVLATGAAEVQADTLLLQQ